MEPSPTYPAMWPPPVLQCLRVHPYRQGPLWDMFTAARSFAAAPPPTYLRAHTHTHRHTQPSTHTHTHTHVQPSTHTNTLNHIHPHTHKHTATESCWARRVVTCDGQWRHQRHVMSAPSCPDDVSDGAPYWQAWAAQAERAAAFYVQLGKLGTMILSGSLGG